MLNWLKTLPARTLALFRAGLERIKRDGPPLLRAGLERVKRVDLSLFRTGLERVKRDGPRWLRVGLGIVASILVLVVLSWAGWLSWDWVQDFWCWLKGSESGSATIRNVVLTIGGPFALWLAWRRSVVAQRGLMNERYQKGAEMLGDNLLAVRLGGIYALQRLAEEDPGQYHVQIMRLFCAFVRHPTKDERVDEKQKKTLLGDIQAIVEMIRTRSEANIALEKEAEKEEGLSCLDLSDADLPHSVFNKADLSKASLMKTDLSEANLANTNLFGADLSGADLSSANLANTNLVRADLSGAVLSCARLTSTNLSGAKLNGTDLNGAVLSHANLSHANLSHADLSGATLDSTEGLIQAQLDKACPDPNKLPKLQDCVDAQTGKQLEWREKSP